MSRGIRKSVAERVLILERKIDERLDRFRAAALKSRKARLIYVQKHELLTQDLLALKKIQPSNVNCFLIAATSSSGSKCWHEAICEWKKTRKGQKL